MLVAHDLQSLTISHPTLASLRASDAAQRLRTADGCPKGPRHLSPGGVGVGQADRAKRVDGSRRHQGKNNQSTTVSGIRISPNAGSLRAGARLDAAA